MAAAAVVVARRHMEAEARRGGGFADSSRFQSPFHLDRNSASFASISSRTPSKSTSGSLCSVCLSVGLLAVGTWMLVSAVENSRSSAVADYDAAVHEWSWSKRPRLAEWDFSAATVVSSGRGDEQPVAMVALTETELIWGSDAEGGQDVQDYRPLRFSSTLELPAFLNNATDGSQYTNSVNLTLLPNRTNAETVKIRLTVAPKNGVGAPQELTTVAMPMAFDERLFSMTPAPDYKCRSEQHGVWTFHYGCHVVRRLASICLQVQENSDGQWELHAPNGGQAYGCSEVSHFEPASYIVDRCWGPRVPTTGCTPVGTRSWSVQLIVRSAEDPLLVAANLTGSRFDFGPSQVHQEVLAGIFLTLGLLSVIPALVAKAYKRRGRAANSGDRTPLSPAAARFGASGRRIVTGGGGSASEDGLS